MFKVKSTKKLAAVAATAVAMGGLVAPVASVFADSKTIPVTYDTRNIVIPDPDQPGAGDWGVVIPTAISFNKEVTEADASVKLVTMGQYAGQEVKDVFTTLDVTAEVTSANAYKLLSADAAADPAGAEYSYKLGDTTFVANTNKQESVTQMHANSVDVKGTATLTKKAKKEGVYKDNLTYHFNATALDYVVQP